MKKILIIFIEIFLLSLIGSCTANNKVVSPTLVNVSTLTQTPTTTPTSTPIPPPTSIIEKSDLIQIAISVVIAIIIWILFSRRQYLMLVRKKEEEERHRQELERQRRVDEQYRKDLLERQRRAEEQQRKERLEQDRYRKAEDHQQSEELAMKEKPIQFHAIWNRYINPDEWKTIYIYIFTGYKGLKGAQMDFAHRQSATTESYDNSSSTSNRQIKHGTQISIQPELKGFQFNPPVANILWLEDWHCVEFRMRALPESSVLNETFTGCITFYVGPISVGEVSLYATLTSPAMSKNSYSTSPSHWEDTWATPYRAIFVSYSHKDSFIVDKLELAYEALGDDYLRDIRVLRSGEDWNPALLNKITEADIFQLCWSEAAKQSTYVEQEWRYALTLNRQNFIRPMYWEIPLPKPPEELSKIHFSYVNMVSNK